MVYFASAAGCHCFDFRDFRVFVFSIRANWKTRKSRKDFSQFQEFFELSGNTLKMCVMISDDRNEELGMTCLLGNDLMLFLVLSGKQRLDSLEIDDFQSWHVEHMLNQHGSIVIVTGKLS